MTDYKGEKVRLSQNRAALMARSETHRARGKWVGREQRDEDILIQSFGRKDFKDHPYVKLSEKHPLFVIFGIPLLIVGAVLTAIVVGFIVLVLVLTKLTYG